jgi:hypothetical protein
VSSDSPESAAAAGARLDDATLIEQFEACTLACVLWCHELHIRMAWWYLSRFPFEEAVSRIRDGILAYNVSCGNAPGTAGGYHETVTVAWSRVIHDALRRTGQHETSLRFCAACPEMLDKHHLLHHYSRDVLDSTEARERFVEPDLVPLPRI